MCFWKQIVASWCELSNKDGIILDFDIGPLLAIHPQSSSPSSCIAPIAPHTDFDQMTAAQYIEELKFGGSLHVPNFTLNAVLPICSYHHHFHLHHLPSSEFLCVGHLFYIWNRFGGTTFESSVKSPQELWMCISLNPKWAPISSSLLFLACEKIIQ